MTIILHIILFNFVWLTLTFASMTYCFVFVNAWCLCLIWKFSSIVLIQQLVAAKQINHWLIDWLKRHVSKGLFTVYEQRAVKRVSVCYNIFCCGRVGVSGPGIWVAAERHSHHAARDGHLRGPGRRMEAIFPRQRLATQLHHQRPAIQYVALFAGNLNKAVIDCILRPRCCHLGSYLRPSRHWLQEVVPSVRCLQWVFLYATSPGLLWASLPQPGGDFEQPQLLCKYDVIYKTGNT